MTVSELEQKVEAWIASPENIAALQEAQEKARISSDDAIADAQVDAELLRQAVTL